MGAFLSYFLLGLSLAAPIGPINAAQLDKGIKNGFWHAWILGLGAALADAIYMALVYFGVVHFLETPFIKTFLWLFGFFVLTYTGIECMLSAVKVTSFERKKQDRLLSSFLTGFIMSISNPLTILFWLGIYGSILAKAAATFDLQHLLFYSGSIFVGIFFWDFSMALVSSSFRRLLTSHVLKAISLISGLSLIAFGLYFGYQAYQMLFK
ncbi:LysE family transporter [Bacillus massiliglaciei]|uniref:LysE family transporter n=1 Tax=Bacillus massiliglaciei TaxID=1816693 RepID=UPI000AE1F3D0|nr:LysE family transporter [Bacillus massiliglaciei]